ncbi:hypothetical protein NDU88_007732 [Pleurodeles waltl]|uniref:Uncharacterized protein n=1 Tax=Pleurodeles waltl TaxID=8319 RepID=A0AAV7U362_PLEWA|nr:hypothetical protein NDU88_007732 [Pleurodeles waltl]
MRLPLHLTSSWSPNPNGACQLGLPLAEAGSARGNRGHPMGWVRLGPWGVDYEVCGQPQAAQSGPEDAQSGPEDAQSGPEYAQSGPEDAQSGSEDAQDAQSGPKDAQSGPEDAQSGPKDAQSGPEDAQSGPEDAQDAQSGPEDAQSGPEDAQSGPEAAARSLPRPRSSHHSAGLWLLSALPETNKCIVRID